MSSEDRIHSLGLTLPDFGRDGYYGTANGPMLPFHRSGSLLFLSGHAAMIGDRTSHRGRLGADLSTEDGHAAARQTGLNCWEASGSP